MMNKPFQFQLLQGEKAGLFTARHLKEARKVFREIREFLLEPDPELEPLRIPYFDFPEEWIFFLALVGDDPELRKVAVFVQYVEKGITVVGLGLKRDEKMWVSAEGKKHLETEDVKTFGVGKYVERAVKGWLEG